MTPASHQESRVGLASTFRPVLDDRGERIGRLNRKDLLRAARSENPRLRTLAHRLGCAAKSEARRTTPDRVVLTVLLVILVLFFNAMLNAVVLPTLGVGGIGIGLVVFVGLIFLAHWAMTAYVRRGALGQIARTAVAEGVCGSCAFPLQDTPPGPDACLVCPECGAAWRAERIVAPFWNEPQASILRTGLRPALIPGVRSVNHLFAADDRGRYVQTPDSRLARLRPDLLDRIPPNERRDLRRAMRRVGRWWRLVLMLGLSWMPALAFWGAWELYLDEEWTGVWVVLVLGCAVATPSLLIPFTAAFCPPHRTCRVLVRHGRCGSCLARLDDAADDDAGRLVCTACGSAWLDPSQSRARADAPPVTPVQTAS